VLTARLSSEVARILEYLERLSATSARLNKQSAKKIKGTQNNNTEL